MKIKMIELLARISNGKDIPKLIEYKGKRYCWVEGGHTKGYKYNGLYWFCDLHNNFDEPDFLNEEVEIIEENKGIKELQFDSKEKYITTIEGTSNKMRNIDVTLATKINELVKEINKIKEKENE